MSLETGGILYLAGAFQLSLKYVIKSVGFINTELNRLPENATRTLSISPSFQIA